MSDRQRDFRGPALSWQLDGWVLLDGLVDPAAIDAAVAELPDFESGARPAMGPTRRADRVGEPRFRANQFDGTTLFPLPGAPHLNRLVVHPAVVEFAAQAMECRDLRIYQSRLWSKYGGRVDYEQPLHLDTNHSLVPARSEPGWWHLECFLYLSDVEEGSGAPRLVPRRAVPEDRPGRTAVDRHQRPDLYRAEVAVPGRRGSLLAYRSDVWHRATDLAPGQERHVLVVAFKPAGLDWIGFDAHPPLVNGADFRTFVAGSTPEELALFGIPRPGHGYWTAELLEEMEAMYPGLDLTPWRRALPGGC